MEAPGSREKGGPEHSSQDWLFDYVHGQVCRPESHGIAFLPPEELPPPPMATELCMLVFTKGLAKVDAPLLAVASLVMEAVFGCFGCCVVALDGAAVEEELSGDTTADPAFLSADLRGSEKAGVVGDGVSSAEPPHTRRSLSHQATLRSAPGDDVIWVGSGTGAGDTLGSCEGRTWDEGVRRKGPSSR